MRDRPRRLLATALLLSALLAPFVLFSTKLNPWRSSDTPGMVVVAMQNALYPVERLFDLSVKSLSRLWYTYVDLSDAARENRQLKTQLDAMKTRIMDYDEQLLENDRLRRLIGFAGRSERRLIAAEVIGHNDTSRFESLRIGRGRRDGVRVGMPVVAADGVVGKVIRTGEAFSDIQLLVDPDFHIDVLLQRTRVRGVLAGASHSQCTLQLHKRIEIRIGDTLITSGIVGSFPKGLPVGRVMRITYDTENVAQSVTVEPWIDHNRLEEVLVILTPDPELEKIAEAAGETWIEQAVDLADGTNKTGPGGRAAEADGKGVRR